jgi:hypothetical protein
VHEIEQSAVIDAVEILHGQTERIRKIDPKMNSTFVDGILEELFKKIKDNQLLK